MSNGRTLSADLPSYGENVGYGIDEARSPALRNGATLKHRDGRERGFAPTLLGDKGQP